MRVRDLAGLECVVAAAHALVVQRSTHPGQRGGQWGGPPLRPPLTEAGRGEGARETASTRWLCQQVPKGGVCGERERGRGVCACVLAGGVWLLRKARMDDAGAHPVGYLGRARSSTFPLAVVTASCQRPPPRRQPWRHPPASLRFQIRLCCQLSWLGGPRPPRVVAP